MPLAWASGKKYNEPRRHQHTPPPPRPKARITAFVPPRSSHDGNRRRRSSIGRSPGMSRNRHGMYWRMGASASQTDNGIPRAAKLMKYSYGQPRQSRHTPAMDGEDSSRNIAARSRAAILKVRGHRGVREDSSWQCRETATDMDGSGGSKPYCSSTASSSPFGPDLGDWQM